jgi:CubicO group peptidase (beta-lactamase class C family)
VAAMAVCAQSSGSSAIGRWGAEQALPTTRIQQLTSGAHIMTRSDTSFDPRRISAGPPHGLEVPKTDWDRAPWNRWSFQHIRELLPTTEVWRGDGPVRQLQRHDRDLDSLMVKNIAGEAATLLQVLDETCTNGLLVLHHGAVAYERYFGGMTPRTLHLSQSVAKSIVGITAGILVTRGLLDLNQHVSHYLPELAATAWAGATLQQVFDMTTGARFNEDYADPHSDVGQLDVASGWKPIPAGSNPRLNWPTHVWDLILGLKHQTRPHGAQFEYRSIETDVLAFCMERVTGKRLAQIISEELWQKLGAEESACFTIDPAGYALADAGFNATLRDYARFGQMILSGGEGIVPKSWIDETRQADHSMFAAPYTIVLPEGGYHNQFWVENPQSRNLMCRGVFGQLIYIDFDHEMVVVKLSSWPEFVSPKKMIATLGAVRSIAAALD